MHFINADRRVKLFLFIACFFVCNALIAESIGVKIFSLEASLGLKVHRFSLFGEQGLSFMLTCGVLLWPLEFVMTDLVNEYYGPKAVRRISWIAVVLISYAFVQYFIARSTEPADWWVGVNAEKGVPDMQKAFTAIFGQGQWIIVGSLIAFMVSQLLDVFVFHKIKKMTGEKYLWLRATGSTVVSQLIDSFIVLFIAFKLGADWSWQKVLAIGCVNYTYKFTMALLLTPVLEIVHRFFDRYLGADVAAKMKLEAMGE